MKSDRKHYNERLFNGRNFRSYLHNSRFDWVTKQIDHYVLEKFNMAEVGCFDGRLLEKCTRPPDLYEGFDAGWEGGISTALQKYKGHPHWKFHLARDPSAMSHLQDKNFDVVAALETMEHIPVELVDPYIAEMARISRGYLFITVPNEKGIVFLAKHLYKKIVHGSAEPYEFREIVYAVLGQMDKVSRNEHKGFNYSELLNQISKRFDIVKVEGIPFAEIPVSLSFTVGIVARARNA